MILLAPNLGAEADDEPVEELVVVASRIPIERHKVGDAVTILNRAQIAQLGYEYAADLLRFVPGVAVSRTGGYGGNTNARVRGAEDNHVVILIDGVDASDAGSGLFDLSGLLTSDIERIEVLRGPQSGLYGSNALAGVINVLTIRPAAGFEVQTHLEAGAHDSRQAAISMSGGTDSLAGRLSYTVRRSEFDLSVDDTLGSEDDRDRNETLSASVDARLADGLSARLVGRLVKRETDTDGFDFSGGPLQGLAVDDATYANTETGTFAGTLRWATANGRSVTNLSVEHTDSTVDGGTYGSAATRSHVELDTTWTWATGAAAHRTTAFVQREEESYRNRFPFDPSQVPTQRRDLLGIGVEHGVELGESVFVNAALRRDRNDDFDDATTYSIDGAYLLDDGATRLHASYGSAVTNPTFFEQFGFVPGTFVGNPRLEPEESTGWEIGVERAWLDGALVTDLTYFAADLTNEIRASFPSVENLRGESERSGVELSVRYRPAEHLSVTGAYTYLDADEPGGEELRRPAHVASLSASRHFLGGRARLSGSVIYNGSMRDTDFRNFFANGFVAERTRLEAYTLVNLKAAYAVTEALELYVRVENLFDENYVEVIGYATPGRAVFAGLRYRLAN